MKSTTCVNITVRPDDQKANHGLSHVHLFKKLKSRAPELQFFTTRRPLLSPSVCVCKKMNYHH